MKKDFKKLFICTSLLVSVFTVISCSRNEELTDVSKSSTNEGKQLSPKYSRFTSVGFYDKDGFPLKVINLYKSTDYLEVGELPGNQNDKYNAFRFIKDKGIFLYIHVFDDHKFTGKNTVFKISSLNSYDLILLSKQLKYSKRCGYFGGRSCKYYWDGCISYYKVYASKTPYPDSKWEGSAVIDIK